MYMQIVRKGAGEKMKNGQQKAHHLPLYGVQYIERFRADYEQFGLLADES